MLKSPSAPNSQSYFNKGHKHTPKTLASSWLVFFEQGGLDHLQTVAEKVFWMGKQIVTYI
jgi:hypothetical protein